VLFVRVTVSDEDAKTALSLFFFSLLLVVLLLAKVALSPSLFLLLLLINDDDDDVVVIVGSREEEEEEDDDDIVRKKRAFLSLKIGKVCFYASHFRYTARNKTPPHINENYSTSTHA